MPLQQDIVGDLRAMLIVLWLAVAFMLAVGCANVANLLLTHAAGRQREFAVRRSVGATNLRLARQLLTESLVLASAGGSLGLAIAFWAVPLMAARLPESFPTAARYRRRSAGSLVHGRNIPAHRDLVRSRACLEFRWSEPRASHTGRW